MSHPKTDKHIGAVFHSDDQTIRKPTHTSSRSDIFSKLVKLVGLSEHRGSKSSTTRREAGRTEGLVAIGEQAHSHVTLDLAADAFSTSKGEKTLRRSSSDSRLSVSVASHDFKVPDLSLIFAPAHAFNTDSGRNKSDKKSIRRKPNHSHEPVIPLAPIPEMSNAFERTSIFSDLSCANISNFADQDALMETDSIRARAAIAMARAQLEHSRPALYNRKLERSSNQMMMLPGELEEHFAGQSSKEREKLSAQLAAHTKNETHDRICEDDLGAMRKAVGQSQAMVLTLMAAKEAISQRATMRKGHHSPLASSSVIDLPKPKRPTKQFQGLYRAGDIPPSPPPCIPLPQLPSRPSLENLDTKSTTPKPESSLRHEIAPSGNAYKGLPTEYSTDDEMLKHIDVLMQSLADSSDNKLSETDRRRPYSSLPSRRGRRSNENSVIDSTRQGHQKKSMENFYRSTSYGSRQPTSDAHRSQPSRPRPTPSFIPPVPALPRLPTKFTPSPSDDAAPTQSGDKVKVENLPVTEMNNDGMLNECHFVLSSYNDFGELTHTTRVSHPQSISGKSSTPSIPSGHTEKYFQQFTPRSSLRHPTLPRSMKLRQYVEPSAAVSSPGRGASTLSNKASTSSANSPGCPPGIISLGFFRSASSIRLPSRSRTPEPTPQRTARLY
ncbi:unnamed protein product [Rhizoctonia solani]|uniref:PGAMP domain protein n=1 Tax=Rhizoctonia solani AG-3 Rhs1AP TaxID=1086054 RepID=X8JDY4_9AGAM|nr:PGAMP domain protein [Rhizoctonia solani AG-3 Rhs1AP]CAE6458100.1 unnamed protein product [Rhizoctonia solani]